MRLIDAEELIKVAEQGITLYSEKGGKLKRGINIDEDIENCYVKYTSVKSLIQDAPTAYNVDKVVEELEAKSDFYEYEDGYLRKMVVLKDAIEIVKRGGKNDIR